MPSLDLTPLSLFFLLFTLGYAVGLVYIVIAERRHHREEGVSTGHAFSLVVPARNEEAVIRSCLDSLLRLEYPEDRYEILVIDDQSSDGTRAIANEYAGAHPGRLLVLQVPQSESGKGKASALNVGYRFLREHSRFRANPDWIVGIFDADGAPDRDMLGKAAFQFQNVDVGGIQASVRIRNHKVSWLTRMQDVEFVGFARMTQIIRTRIAKSASLGGNGQFVRSAALEEVALDPERTLFWDPDALTEDLELSTRLTLRNWDMYQLDTSQVWQEGVEDAGSLIRQRTRWAWGSIQVFAKYVVGMRILRTPNVKPRKRLDLLFNLSMFLVSPLVLVTWLLTFVAYAGLLHVSSAFPGPVMLLLSFGYFPVVGYGLLNSEGYRRRRIAADLVGFAIYAYHWVPCLYLGLWHVVAGHVPIWWKTSRAADQSAS
jgi:cellulose synthase/poly-beta-1,6-N-acetylglucosamine synthase-like glycosyltransferase